MNGGNNALPYSAVSYLSQVFGDYLELAAVCHSDRCYTVSILDTDNRYLTFRLNLSLVPHWTVAPVAGFTYGEDLKLQ